MFKNIMNIEFVDFIVRYAIYFLLILGSWMIAFPLIQPLFKRQLKYRKISATKLKKSRMAKHIEKLLLVTTGGKSTYAVYTFFLIVILLFTFSYIFLSSIGQNFLIKGVYSTLVALIPYVYLRVRLYSIQVESSYEGEELIGELSNQYKINYFNMSEAISKTVPRLKRSPYTRKALFRLANQLPQYKTEEELYELIEEFTFSIGTEWAILLGNNIKIGLTSENLVTEAMDDVLEDLKDLNSINEKYKQQNHESYTMIKFVTPLSYITSIIVMFKMFGFTMNKFIDYQFKNPMGFKFFTLSLILMVVNYMIYIVLKRPKNDF